MSRFCTLTMLAALTVSSAAYADKPAAPPAADKPAAPPADKPATKAADKPADKAADKPAGGKKVMVSEADAARFYAFFDRLVAIITLYREDCAKMAGGINEHITASQAVLKDAAASKAAGKELPQATSDKIAKKTMEELVPAMQHKCGKDKGVTDAFMRLKPPSAK